MGGYFWPKEARSEVRGVWVLMHLFLLGFFLTACSIQFKKVPVVAGVDGNTVRTPYKAWSACKASGGGQYLLYYATVSQSELNVRLYRYGNAGCPGSFDPAQPLLNMERPVFIDDHAGGTGGILAGSYKFKLTPMGFKTPAGYWAYRAERPAYGTVGYGAAIYINPEGNLMDFVVTDTVLSGELPSNWGQWVTKLNLGAFLNSAHSDGLELTSLAPPTFTNAIDSLTEPDSTIENAARSLHGIWRTDCTAIAATSLSFVRTLEIKNEDGSEKVLFKGQLYNQPGCAGGAVQEIYQKSLLNIVDFIESADPVPFGYFITRINTDSGFSHQTLYVNLHGTKICARELLETSLPLPLPSNWTDWKNGSSINDFVDDISSSASSESTSPNCMKRIVSYDVYSPPG